MAAPAGSAPLAACVAALKAALPETSWSEDPMVLAPRLTEWRGKWTGHTPLLLMPASVAEAQTVMRICFEHQVPVTPQGGNTGLVGGQIPFGTLLISTHRLKAVRAVSAADDVMVLEAGVTLLEAQQAAAGANRFFPLSLAAEGTASIGGNLSTNAGGTAVLRYGMMRDLVLGLEVVLPDGRLYEGLRRLRKNNTGYDLKNLFIGAEGTLGLITAASLKLFPRMTSRATAMVGFETAEQAITLLSRAKEETGGLVEAFELMGRYGLSLVLKHIPDTREPLDGVYPWYALIEITAGAAGQAEAAMERVLETAFEEGLILDAAIAQNETQAKAFWRLREDHSAAEKCEGACWKHDISVPLSRMAEWIGTATEAVEAFEPGARVVAFGHVGDGNVHFNVIQPEGADPAAFNARRDDGARVVHDLVNAYEGSISAEHGLGRMKAHEAAVYKSEAELDLMRAVRAAIDPKGLMNPGVLF